MKKFVVTITEYENDIQVGEKSIAKNFLGNIGVFDTEDEAIKFLPSSMDEVCSPLEEEFARLENENWGGEYIDKDDIDLSDYIIVESKECNKLVDFKDFNHCWKFLVEEIEIKL